MNSKYLDLVNCGPEPEPVVLTGLEPDKKIDAFMVRNVPISFGGRKYKWDLYVAPIQDDFLMGLDFLMAFQVDPIISRGVIMVKGKEIPATILCSETGKEFQIHSAKIDSLLHRSSCLGGKAYSWDSHRAPNISSQCPLESSY